MHLDWLLPLLPYTNHYVEPYGGSAAVLLNRWPSPMETYNDINYDIVNFFEVLRNDLPELERVLRLTPWSRREFEIATTDAAPDDPVERARRFFVKVHQARGAVGPVGAESNWSFDRSHFGNKISSKVAKWTSGIDGLTQVAARLLAVQIENRPALDVVDRLDSPDAFFYCDPPYDLNARNPAANNRPHSTRGRYTHEMTDADHVALAERLHRIEGLAAVSGYRSALYDDLYRDWPRHDQRVVSVVAAGPATERVESVWTNYETPGFVPYSVRSTAAG